MKFNQILTCLFATVILSVSSCKDDDFATTPGTSYSGILIANEALVNTPSATIDFISTDLSTQKSDIYTAVNKESLGSILQSVGFKGNNAYLVMNNSNKIEIVNRLDFKKTATVTSNLLNPRYIAFSDNQYYVTNNNFKDVKKLNIYKSDNTFVKSINFDRYAEKVIEASGNIIVQTDGVAYDATNNYAEYATGQTLTIVRPSANTIDKVVTLPDSGIIRDLVSYEGYAYALSSGTTNSYIYKINATDGTFTTTLTEIPNAQKLRIDSGYFYFLDSGNKVYSKLIVSPTSEIKTLFTAPGYGAYGFNIIDNKIFVSDASFTGESTSYVYNASTGAQIKSFKSGIGTNGFYKN